MKNYDDQFIVVTGGAGFIGSGVIRHLNDLGMSNIVIVDDLGKSFKWKNLVGKRFVDIIPIHRTFEWLDGRENLVDAFIHLGACVNTVETDASYLLENNYSFSVKLAEYALKHNHRFIYASSAATYGDGSKGFSDDHEMLQELVPLNMYGYSKHLFDLWARNEGVLDKIVGLKYFNVFGPNENHKERMASAIYNILPSVLREGVIRLFKSSQPQLFGDGEQKRDFVYVKDVARMTCAFLDNPASGIFNVASGVASSWNELAHHVFKGINKTPNIQYIDMPADLINQYQNYTCADMKKTRQALKDAAICLPFEKSVVEYIQEYLIPKKTW